MLNPGMYRATVHLFFFFFNDTATTEIYTLSLHDALPISRAIPCRVGAARPYFHDTEVVVIAKREKRDRRDRKSTRLNSSHDQISYAVFCLKKKTKKLDAAGPAFQSFASSNAAQLLCPTSH